MDQRPITVTLTKRLTVVACRASNVVDAGGATMSRYEETAEPGEAEDAVDMALDPRIVCWSHTCYRLTKLVTQPQMDMLN